MTAAQLANTVYLVLNLYSFVIFIWAILSWIPSSKTVRDIYKVLDTVVAPYVNLFRKMLPPMGGMDFSPFIALIVLQLIGRLLLGFIH